jgi:hypothetical protein
MYYLLVTTLPSFFLFLSPKVVIERIGGLGWLASTGMTLMWGAGKKYIRFCYVYVLDFTLICRLKITVNIFQFFHL